MSETTLATHTTFTVYVVVALMNFSASVIQGVAGIGDAIFLQVMWAICAAASNSFLETPLGKESVVVVTLIMYMRLLFMSPLIVYLGLSDSIFSKQMVLMMAIPSTILSVIGVLLLPYANVKVLKLLLAISSLFFAGVYGCIIVLRRKQNADKISKLKEQNVNITAENEAIKNEVKLSKETNPASLHASFASLNPPAAAHTRTNSKADTLGASMSSNNGVSNHSIVLQHIAQDRSNQIQNLSFIGVGNASFIGARSAEGSVNSNPIDPETGLPEGTTEAFVSTTLGEVFGAEEAKVPHPTEDNVPLLSPGKLSPLSTMTYTRVRINRNLDENGKIKMQTKIAASVAASIAGLMTSLTGVNAPPQIIFILLFDAPNYIVRVNFSAQSIPSNILRTILGMFNGTFKLSQIPLFLDVVIFGFAGLVVGNHIGRMLGPNAFNLFVLCLLLLSAASMLTKNLPFLVSCVALTGVVTVVFAYYENKQNKEKVEEQRQQEQEIEQRVYDVYEDLIRNNNSFFPGSAAMNNLTANSVSISSKKSAHTFDNDDFDAAPLQKDVSGSTGVKSFDPMALGMQPSTTLMSMDENRGLSQTNRSTNLNKFDNDEFSNSNISGEKEGAGVSGEDDIRGVQEKAANENYTAEAARQPSQAESLDEIKAGDAGIIVHHDVLGSSGSSLDANTPPEVSNHTRNFQSADFVPPKEETREAEEEEDPKTEAAPLSHTNPNKARDANYDPLYDDDDEDENMR